MAVWSTGFKYKTRIPRLHGNLRNQIEQRAFLAAQEVRAAALKGMTGTRSGRKYRVPGTKRYYRASKPGEYPAVPTGRLRTSIRAVVLGRTGAGGSEVVGVVGTDVHYGIYLEFGTKNRDNSIRMERRPWLWLAFQDAKQKVWDILTGEWELL